MSVLLVEDEELIRETLAEELKYNGLGVVEAGSAEDALAQAGVDPACLSVLVTDVDLGRGMDGIALAAEARRRWPWVRVVVMTGDPGNLDRLSPSVAGHAFTKPFSPASLVARVRGLVARRPR